MACTMALPTAAASAKLATEAKCSGSEMPNPTAIGSFVNLRGGHVFPEMVAASEKKPIRVFLQDGRNDNRGVGRGGAYDEKRDWFFQNVRLMKALTAKGYEVNYAWGLNRHGQAMGGAIMPEMMRWLWRDQPVSVDARDQVERSFREPVR